MATFYVYDEWQLNLNEGVNLSELMTCIQAFVTAANRQGTPGWKLLDLSHEIKPGYVAVTGKFECE